MSEPLNSVQLEFGFCAQTKTFRVRYKQPQEFKIISLRESPPPHKRWTCETPEEAAAYWRSHVASAPWFSEDRECFVAIFLNVRNRVIGHHLVSIGLLDQVIIHAREAFRAAIIAAAYSVIFGHNHPTGDPTPSQADIAATADLVRAGQLLKIQVTDHIIVGQPNFSSLRQLGMMG